MTLEQLLMALNAPNLPNLPAPAAPMSLGPIAPPPTPIYGGPSQAVEPPQAPLDLSLIPQYQQFAGPPPVAPRPASRLEIIGGVLGGIAEGFAGRGPEFVAQLKEPQRRYEAQVENYNNRRAALGLEGFQAARSDQ